MGQMEVVSLLSQIRLYTFEVCETVVFIALAISLTIHTIKLIVEFGPRGNGSESRTKSDASALPPP